MGAVGGARREIGRAVDAGRDGDEVPLGRAVAVGGLEAPDASDTVKGNREAGVVLDPRASGVGVVLVRADRGTGDLGGTVLVDAGHEHRVAVGDADRRQVVEFGQEVERLGVDFLAVLVEGGRAAQRLGVGERFGNRRGRGVGVHSGSVWVDGRFGRQMVRSTGKWTCASRAGPGVTSASTTGSGN
ncbi:MAG: hypothetical protein ABEJ89_06405 [Haloarculaceae archaeon]